MCRPDDRVDSQNLYHQEFHLSLKVAIQLLIQVFIGIIKLQKSLLPIFQSAQSDVATDGNVIQNKVVSGIQNDDPNHILDRTRFPSYVHAHSWISTDIVQIQIPENS